MKKNKMSNKKMRTYWKPNKIKLNSEGQNIKKNNEKNKKIAIKKIRTRLYIKNLMRLND
jgi:hypothetical protein